MNRAIETIEKLIFWGCLSWLGMVGCDSGGEPKSDSTSSISKRCEGACDRLQELTRADIEFSLSRMPAEKAETSRPRLMKMLEESERSHKASCQSKCRAGQLDVDCVARVQTIDGAQTCVHKTKGRRTPEAVSKAGDRTGELRKRTDWRDVPLEPIKDRVGELSFSIDLPRGLTRDEADETYIFYEFEGAPWNHPGFHFMLRKEPLPATPEAALEYIDPPGQPIVLRNERVGSTHVVVYRNEKGTYVVSHVLHPAGEQVIQCWGTQTSSKKELPLEETGVWFAKICGGLRANP